MGLVTSTTEPTLKCSACAKTWVTDGKSTHCPQAIPCRLHLSALAPTLVPECLCRGRPTDGSFRQRRKFKLMADPHFWPLFGHRGYAAMVPNHWIVLKRHPTAELGWTLSTLQEDEVLLHLGKDNDHLLLPNYFTLILGGGLTGLLVYLPSTVAACLGVATHNLWKAAFRDSQVWGASRPFYAAARKAQLEYRKYLRIQEGDVTCRRRWNHHQRVLAAWEQKRIEPRPDVERDIAFHHEGFAIMKQILMDSYPPKIRQLKSTQDYITTMLIRQAHLRDYVSGLTIPISVPEPV